MSYIIRCGQSYGWSGWIDEDSSERGIRIINNSLKLPFRRVPNLGIGDYSSEFIARWSFGYRGYLWNTLNVDLDNDDDSLDPSVVANVDHQLSETSTVILSEDGFNSTVRSGYATVTDDDDFVHPCAHTSYVSCWVKSNRTDYSDGVGFIAGYYLGTIFAVPTERHLGFGLMVDTDNKYKAYVTTDNLVDPNRPWMEIPPVGGEVSVDTNWHHLLLAINRQSKPGNIFIIDNEWGDGPINGVHNVSAESSLAGGMFSIGSSEVAGETSYGFSGIIDELVFSDFTVPDPDLDVLIAAHSGELSQSDVFGIYNPAHRFERQVFISPVFDTQITDGILSGLYCDYDSSYGTAVEFSFRASNTEFDQTDSTPEWSGFTAPNKVRDVNSISELGVFIKGRYQQVKMRLNPSEFYSSSIHAYTPIVNSLELRISVSDKLIVASNTAYEPGTILAQIVNFDETKRIDKVSLNLTVTTMDRKDFVVGSSGILSFQSANFQSGRHTWAFQPAIHWGESNSWETSGTTMRNRFQEDSYLELEDALANAPYLKYSLYFPSGGTWDLWGYGYTKGLWWSFNDDITDLRLLTLGDDSSGWAETPKWTRFGTIFIDEGGIYSFIVYLQVNALTLLDQWYFTKNNNLSEDLGTSGLSLPLPLSEGPFNTVVRLRSLTEGQIVNLTDNEDPYGPYYPTINVASWLPSTNILASGKFNYEIRDNSVTSGVNFTNGLSIEYWQIGGSNQHFAAWDYLFPSVSVGNIYKSTNYGQTYI